MMVGWGVGAAVGTSDGIDEDGIDEGAVVGSTVVGMDDGAAAGATVGMAVTFMSAQTMCPMRLRSTPSNSAR